MTTPMRGRTARLLLAFALVAAIGLGTHSSVAADGSFVDVATSPFRADIEWLASRGVTAGCDRDRYCPDAPMTREQMASMLARMFSLPPTGRDYFADDAGSVHEPNINRLAAAGIAAGCGTGRFCPRASVSRAQMASFLVRAAGLRGAAPDHFLDDDGSVHRGDIDRAAMAGITAGCHQYVFCSSMPVTRGQMAAFLRRSEQPISSPSPLPVVGPLPACRYDDVLTPHAATEDWPLTLLDTIYALPAAYGPGPLVDSGTAGLNGGYRVRAGLVADLRAMADAARQARAPIGVTSAYRSYDSQVATFNHWVAVSGRDAALRRSARPGHSEHQLGTTIDARSADGGSPWLVSDWARTSAGSWMRDNAWRYGFVMSYPRGASAITCYDYEPWHYRYVGRSMAAAVRASGLTLREWLWRTDAGG